MSEKDIIARTRRPGTVSSIAGQLQTLGVAAGDIVLVHSSLSRMGWVCGGPQAVIEALLLAVGAEGTIVAPAHSGDRSDPAAWQNPPVPEDWIETIRDELPAFDPAQTPTYGMGKIAELFRTWPGALRSQHPQVSFAAKGRAAADIVSRHPLSPQFGEQSPLGRLYDLDAKVLLLGVGYESCTCMHLAETRLEHMPRLAMGTAVLEEGVRVWRRFEDFAYDIEGFDTIGLRLERSGLVASGRVGEAECRLLRVRDAVDRAEIGLRALRRYEEERR